MLAINNFLVGSIEHMIYYLISGWDKDKFAVSIITVLDAGSLEANSWRTTTNVAVVASLNQCHL